MKTSVILNKDIENVIKDKRIILILGDMGSGKSTEVSEVANLINKPTYVVMPNYHQEDIDLFDKFGFNKIVVDPTTPTTQKLKSALKGISDCIVIFDDYHSSSIRQREVIKSISVDLRKRKMILILVYHSPEGIPKRLLKDNNSILLLKRNNGMNYYKLAQFFTTKGITSSSVKFADSITDYDTAYVLKSGKYLYRYSDSKITRGIIKPDKNAKIRVKIDKKKVLHDCLSNLSNKEIANKYGVSQSTIYNIIKEEKQANPTWEKTYENSKSKRIVGKVFPKSTGEWTKTGIKMTIINETLTEGNSTKKQLCCEIGDLKDIGDYATQVIGESIYEELKILVDNQSIAFAEILIIKARIGCDIKIELPNKLVDIEVKNWEKTKKQPNITKKIVKNRVIPRFKDSVADSKFLFCLGRGCTKTAQYMLKQKGIDYWRLTNKQLKDGDKDRTYNVRQRMKSFVSSLFKN